MCWRCKLSRVSFSLEYKGRCPRWWRRRLVLLRPWQASSPTVTLYSGLLRGRKTHAAGGKSIEFGYEFARPRHELRFRCATASAPLLCMVTIVSIAPVLVDGSDGNLCAGGTAPISGHPSHAGDAPPHHISFLSSLCGNRDERKRSLQKNAASRRPGGATARGMTRAGGEVCCCGG